MIAFRNFLHFWYEFIVGDDWRIAAVVIAGVGTSAWLAGQGVNAWWLLPLLVAVVLGMSLLRVARTHK